MTKSQIYGRVSRVLAATPLAYCRVRVRAGFAKGAQWTLLPFSSYWRLGGAEQDVLAATSYLPTLNGIVFWDFGAHFGIHTVGMGMQVGPTGQVAAFEPDPGAFRRLQYHVEINHLSNVRLFEAAASRTSGRGNLYLPGGKGSAVSHLRYYASDDMTGVDSISVPTIAPDDLVAEGKIRAPHIIKIDVQGHGAEAGAGAINTIRTTLPIIAFSNHSEAERSGIQRLLEPLSYAPVHFDGSSCAWLDITEALLIPDQLFRSEQTT
jgi:FkbM family methyltransferase